MQLHGKIALITGATRGIGRAIALELAKEGADIIFTFAKSDDLAKQLVSEITELDRTVYPVKIDTRDFENAQKLIEECREKFGAIDILVNNAGITRDKALMLMSKEDWQEVIDTNLSGVFNMTRAVITTFLRQKSGNIINITSVSGIIGVARQANYAASKAGIIGFTKAMAREVAPFGVRVNAVAPGFIDTDMTAQLKADHKESLVPMIPLARFGRAEEVAKVVAFLASEASGYITGQVIRVDGGLGIQ